MAGKSKTESKTVAEKIKAPLSSKRQAEADHIVGKHKIGGDESLFEMTLLNPECGFCQRAAKRQEKKSSKRA